MTGIFNSLGIVFTGECTQQRGSFRAKTALGNVAQGNVVFSFRYILFLKKV
jgi:hypothetical protein